MILVKWVDLAAHHPTNIVPHDFQFLFELLKILLADLGVLGKLGRSFDELLADQVVAFVGHGEVELLLRIPRKFVSKDSDLKERVEVDF